MAHIQAEGEQRKPHSPAAYAAYYASQLSPSTSKAASVNPTSIVPGGELGNGKRKADDIVEDEATKKKRIAREEDALLMREAAHRVSQAILADQLAVTYPDYKTPFRDAADVVQRLLPYHIFQQPDEDLLPIRKPSRKGKEKETEVMAALRADVDDLKTTVSLLKRRKALQERFRKARTKEAERPSSSEQLYQIQYLAVDDDRRYNALLNSEIRATRDQLAQLEKDAKEKKEKEQAEAKKAQQAYASQVSAQQQASSSTQPLQTPGTSTFQAQTTKAPANPYAAYATAGVVPAGTTAQPQPTDYRTAYLQYAQAWAAYAHAQAAAQRSGASGAPAGPPAVATPVYTATQASPPASTTPLYMGYSPAAVQSPLTGAPVSTPVTVNPPLPATAVAQASSPATRVPPAPATPSTSQAASVARSVPSHPIPLQIPSSVLPAFESLGIRPIPASEAATMTEKPPPAVLVGSRENGQMLDITINLSLLNPPQLSGLAAVLNMLKTNGVPLQATGTSTTASPAAAAASPASPVAARTPVAAQNPAIAAYYASYFPQYYQARTTPPGTPSAQPMYSPQQPASASTSAVPQSGTTPASSAGHVTPGPPSTGPAGG